MRRRPRSGTVTTVRGDVAPEQLGFTLPHEHILVDFTPAAERTPGRYDSEEVFQTVLPHLVNARERGVQTLVEMTPDFLGRDVMLLRRLSQACGLHIITNTGYYGAREDVHLPQYVFNETAEQIASRWTAERREGIAGTGIRPGLMKIGVDRGSLSEVDSKLIRAAAMSHLATGLTIAVHTGPAVPAFEQLEILEESGVHPGAWIWVHAQAEQDLSRHAEAARRGAWVSFDGVNPETIDRNVELLRNMKENALLDHVLISHDSGWYSVGEPGGGEFRGYTALTDLLLPALRRSHFTDAEIDLLVRINPAEALRVRVRAIN